jgi:hypothetical protein
MTTRWAVLARYRSALDLSNPLNSMSKIRAVKYLYKLIGKIPDGIFTDNSWTPIREIFSVFKQNNIDYDIKSANYIRLEAKVWKFGIEFINDKGKLTTIYGNITAAGAGSVEDPLDRYDVTVVLG